MTITSKSVRVRDIAASTGSNAFRAAKIFGAGPAGIGLELTKGGYGLARRKFQGRDQHRTVDAPARRRVSPLSRKFLAFGALTAAAAGAALVVARRRSAVEPPADAPPSLADYADTPTPVNGSSADLSQK